MWSIYLQVMGMRRGRIDRTHRTYCLLGANTMVLESLKCTPTVPSVNAYPIPYLCA